MLPVPAHRWYEGFADATTAGGTTDTFVMDPALSYLLWSEEQWVCVGQRTTTHRAIALHMAERQWQGMYADYEWFSMLRWHRPIPNPRLVVHVPPFQPTAADMPMQDDDDMHRLVGVPENALGLVQGDPLPPSSSSCCPQCTAWSACARWMDERIDFRVVPLKDAAWCDGSIAHNVVSKMDHYLSVVRTVVRFRQQWKVYRSVGSSSAAAALVAGSVPRFHVRAAPDGQEDAPTTVVDCLVQYGGPQKMQAAVHERIARALLERRRRQGQPHVRLQAVILRALARHSAPQEKEG